MTNSVPRNRHGDPIPTDSTRLFQMASGFGVLAAGTVLGQQRQTHLWAPFDPAADDGRQVARGILHSTVDTAAESYPLQGRVIRGYHEVARGDVVWPVGECRAKWDAIDALERAGISLVDSPPEG